MIIVLKRGTEAEQVAEVVKEARRRGLEVHALTAGDKPVLHVVSGNTRRARKLLKLERVQALVPTSGPRVRRQGRRFFPYHFLNWSSAALMLLATLVLLAGQFPPGLGATPDSRAPVGALELPWYAASVARFLGGLPGWASAVVLLAVPLFLLALPTIDRRLSRSKEGA
jgi:hypothetical protein